MGDPHLVIVVRCLSGDQAGNLARGLPLGLAFPAFPGSETTTLAILEDDNRLNSAINALYEPEPAANGQPYGMTESDANDAADALVGIGALVRDAEALLAAAEDLCGTPASMIVRGQCLARAVVRLLKEKTS